MSLSVSSSSYMYVCWRTGVFTARHRRTSQTTYPSRLLMATAVTSGPLTLQLWWLGLPDARRSATVRFPRGSCACMEQSSTSLRGCAFLEPPEDMVF